MEIQILSTETIKPSKTTPDHLRSFKLSFLDQIVACFYIPIIIFYDTKFTHEAISEIHTHLKKSLSETLTIYYPLAGRVLQDKLTIDCNDEGASYAEAKANFTMSRFLENPEISFLNEFLPHTSNVLENEVDKTLLLVQVTVLDCGGIVIGTCVHHRAADIVTMSSFLKTWSSICNETCEREIAHSELRSGSLLFPPVCPLPEDYVAKNVNNYFGGTKNSRTRRFVFDSTSVETLREKAASEAVPRPTRIEALTGFISERIIKATSETSTRKNIIMISHPINIRRRLNPPLPEHAFGNFPWFAFVFYSSSESDDLDLPAYVERLRESLEAVNGESLSELNIEAAFLTLSASLGLINENDDIKHYKFTSWCNMGVYDIDFGYGKPAWVAHMGDALNRRTKHQFLFIEGRNNGEIEMWMLFEDDELAILENDSEFLEYAKRNPCVSNQEH